MNDNKMNDEKKGFTPPVEPAKVNAGRRRGRPKGSKNTANFSDQELHRQLKNQSEVQAGKWEVMLRKLAKTKFLTKSTNQFGLATLVHMDQFYENTLEYSAEKFKILLKDLKPLMAPNGVFVAFGGGIEISNLMVYFLTAANAKWLRKHTGFKEVDKTWLTVVNTSGHSTRGKGMMNTTEHAIVFYGKSFSLTHFKTVRHI
jgi:hypothetical protein